MWKRAPGGGLACTRFLPAEDSAGSTSIRAAALVLQRSIPVRGLAARLRVLYSPRGPLLRDWADTGLRQQVWNDLRRLGQEHGAIFIKIDPDLPLGMGIPGQPGAMEAPLGLSVQAELQREGWLFSGEQVQFRNTVVINLALSEDELLSRMKQKSRYNIRLAERKGVKIRAGGLPDLPLLYQMYAETSVRDRFVIRDQDYYRRAWAAFLRQDAGSTEDCLAQPVAEPLIADVDGQPVAAVIPFHFGGRAWYLYGMSRDQHRERMPNYLLQWEALQRARMAGCSEYDLWGAPDRFDESDPLWGVYRFKEGLGGEVVRGLGAWDLPVQPLLYRLYTQAIPRLLGVMRKRGQAQTKSALSV